MQGNNSTEFTAPVANPDFIVTHFEFSPDKQTVGNPLRRKITIKNVAGKNIRDVARVELCCLGVAGKALDTSVCFVRNAWEMDFNPEQELTLTDCGADFPDGTIKVIVTRYGYNYL